MSPFLYEIIVYLVEALISGIFLINMLEEKYHKWVHFTLWCEIVIVAMLCTPSFSIVRIGVIALLEFAYTYFMFEDKPKIKIGVFLLKEALLITASAVSYAISSLFIGVHANFFSSCRSDNCTYCLLYLLMFSILISIVFQFTKERKGVEFPWVIGTQVVIGFGEATAVLAVAAASGGVINSKESWFIIIAMICMVAANVSIGMLAPYLLRQVTMSTNMDYGQELSSMEYKYYEMSVENDKKLHSIRHDISNHIQTIYSLFSNGENQRGLELINELKSRYALVDQMVYCNNPVVNIILSNKKSEAEDKNIETHIKVKENLDNMPITDFDLSTVICNLLDNAIRGCICSEQSHPRLIVEILQKNQYLVIRVLNSCKVGMNIESTDRIETTKSKSQTHGLGMPIISGIAKKYRGDFIVSAQNGIFTATVVMSIKGNKSAKRS